MSYARYYFGHFHTLDREIFKMRRPYIPVAEPGVEGPPAKGVVALFVDDLGNCYTMHNGGRLGDPTPLAELKPKLRKLVDRYLTKKGY